VLLMSLLAGRPAVKPLTLLSDYPGTFRARMAGLERCELGRHAQRESDGMQEGSTSRSEILLEQGVGMNRERSMLQVMSLGAAGRGCMVAKLKHRGVVTIRLV
jgi:hypothetical protein